MLAAASLELKAEKQSAHSSAVASVAFSPDGKSIVSGSCDIVSGSSDRTLKVWDCTAIGNASQWEKRTEKGKPKGMFRKHESIAIWVNTVTGEKRYSDPGAMYRIEPTKVWDAGVSALTPSNP